MPLMPINTANENDDASRFLAAAYALGTVTVGGFT
jgi:hypothetical protein